MAPVSHCCLFKVWLNKYSHSVNLPLHTVGLSGIVQHLTNHLGSRLNPIMAATTLHLKSYKKSQEEKLGGILLDVMIM